MLFVQKLNWLSLADTLVSVTVAFVLGGLIGLERQYRQRTAGLRTNILVALGAAIFVDLANHLHGAEGATHVIAYVVSGIGFLGAGAIMREEGGVRGLNTAATLWCSGAVGACAGSDLIGEAVIATIFILAANTLLRPVISVVNQQPMDAAGGEFNHAITVIAPRGSRKAALRALEGALDNLHLPVRELKVEAFGESEVELIALLSATAVKEAVLDQLVAELSDQEGINQAFWSPTPAM